MSKKIKVKGQGALSDVNPDDVGNLFSTLVKVLQDLFKKNK